MAVVPPHERDVDIDIGHLARALWRRKLAVLLVAAAFAGAALAAASFVAPRYKSDAQIVIEDRESAYTRPASASGALPSDALDAESVESQVSLITSAEILGDVAGRFRLAERAEFAPDPSLLDRLIARIQPASRVTTGEVVETMRETLNVFRKENTRVIVVEFSSRDPELARDVPNAIAAEYLARQKGALLSSNTSATGWLEEEIEDLRKAVREAEGRVAGFRASSDLLVGQNRDVLATQQLSEIATELSRTRAARAAAEGRAGSIREALERGGSLDSVAEVLSSPTVQALRERQVALKAEIADLSTTLLEGHPRLRSLRSQLRDLDTEIAGEAIKVQSSLETEADSARQRESALTAEMDRLKSEAARAGSQEVELRSLEREAESQSQLLESYLTRYREAVARGARDYLPVDARVFSQARMPPEPYFPKILPITAAAGLAGFLAAALGILVAEIFSGRGLQAAGPVCEPALAEAAPAVRPVRYDGPASPPPTHDGPSPVSADDIADAMIASGIGRVVVLAAEDRSGAVGGVALARALAARAATVVLLDLAGDGAALAAMGIFEDAPGLAEIVAGRARYAEVIHRDSLSAANAIGAGRSGGAGPPAAADLRHVFAALAEAYDCTVVECGGMATDRLLALLDEEAGLVIAQSPDFEAAAALRLNALNAAGHVDVLVMASNDAAAEAGSAQAA